MATGGVPGSVVVVVVGLVVVVDVVDEVVVGTVAHATGGGAFMRLSCAAVLRSVPPNSAQ
jgi:hypothetical protein